MKAWLKKYRVPLLILVLLAYLVVGATAPFIRYKTAPESSLDIDISQFYQDGPGIDRAMILETNESAWEERLRLMNLARERIILSTFDFRDGESSRDLLAVMLHKADEGVKVQILVDGFSGLVRMEGRELFYALSSHPNVEIRIYNRMNPLLPWKTQGRMHDKYLIADDYAYILGGRNSFDYFIGSYPTDSRSYDREVLVYNTQHGCPEGMASSLGQVEDYFSQVWNLDVCTPFHDDPSLADKASVKETRQLLLDRYDALAAANPGLLDHPDQQGPPDQNNLDYYQERTVETGAIRLISNPTGIYAKEPVVFCTLAALMEQARDHVTIHTPYVVFNSYMDETMSRIASKVPVTMMINSVENGDNFFASSDYLRHRKQMAATGIRLYEYDGGMSYHGKSIVIDNELAIIGSYNFDLRSTYVDTELMLAIQSRELAGQLGNHMDSYQKDCRLLLTDGTYRIPGHLQIAEAPLWKRAAWRAAGLLMQPFRVLI